VNEILAALGPYIIAALALAGTVYTIRSQQPGAEAEASARRASASATTIDDLMEEISRLNLKVSSQLLQIQELRKTLKATSDLTARLLVGLTTLLDEIHKSGLNWTWKPDPEIVRMVDEAVAQVAEQKG
jgi:Na+/H+ antiporter NhaC